MDFEGQKLAEAVMSRLMVLLGLLAFGAGYAYADYMLMVKLMGVGLALTSILVLPPWPWFKRSPLQWLPPLYPTEPKPA